MTRLNKLYSGVLLFVLASCYPAPKVAGQFTDQEFETMATEMAKGDAKDINVDDLVRIKQNVILLDSREKKEYDISHIPGAIWVGYDDFDINRIQNINKDSKLVVYCSVGYRSERVSEKIQGAGYTDVQNLKGSIFKWINKGYTVVDKDGNQTNKIHGYNKKWSKWVKSEDIILE